MKTAFCYRWDYITLKVCVNHSYPKNFEKSSKKNLAHYCKVFRTRLIFKRDNYYTGRIEVNLPLDILHKFGDRVHIIDENASNKKAWVHKGTAGIICNKVHNNH